MEPERVIITMSLKLKAKDADEEGGARLTAWLNQVLRLPEQPEPDTSAVQSATVRKTTALERITMAEGAFVTVDAVVDLDVILGPEGPGDPGGEFATWVLEAQDDPAVEHLDAFRVTSAVVTGVRPAFPKADKVARLFRHVVVTEKLDGQNCLVLVQPDGTVLAGGKDAWLDVETDGSGFAAWVRDHADELRNLGPGAHRGEWWGGPLNPKRHRAHAPTFSLYNTSRWGRPEARPACCNVVPVLYEGPFSEEAIRGCIARLRAQGSVADPGNNRPEGVVVYHVDSDTMFKVTLKNDHLPKSLAAMDDG